VIFPPITSIKKKDYTLLQKEVKRKRKTVNLEAKMLVIRKTEAGEKRSNIGSSLSLAPATASTIIANVGKIKNRHRNYKIARIKYKLHCKF
jgi:hypothetical protein